jgi:hypothetical protein
VDDSELRLHLLVKCDQPVQALRCRAMVKDLIKDMELQVVTQASEGNLGQGQGHGESFKFLEKK